MPTSSATFPYLISGLKFSDLASKKNTAEIKSLCNEHGALLFRHSEVNSIQTFSEFCQALGGLLADYVGGGSPRTHLNQNIYTSTEYPKAFTIPLHNEASYMKLMPAWIFFFSLEVAQEGGATPIGFLSELEHRLPQEYIEAFSLKNLCYFQNLHSGKGLGKSWQMTFESDDLHEVMVRLTNLGLSYEWKGDDILSVYYPAPSFRLHPKTGQKHFCNQVVNWHESTLEASARKILYRIYKDPALFPKGVTWEDGSPIPTAWIDRMQSELTALEHKFQWHKYDVMMIDNHRVAHGRASFSGQRQVLVGMSL